jgi:hypothetical protein
VIGQTLSVLINLFVRGVSKIAVLISIAPTFLPLNALCLTSVVMNKLSANLARMVCITAKYAAIALANPIKCAGLLRQLWP